MKTEKEIILENLDFFCLEIREGHFDESTKRATFTSYSKKFATDSGEFSQIQLENEEDFKEVKRAIIEKLKREKDKWCIFIQKYQTVLFAKNSEGFIDIDCVDYDFTCFSLEEQEEIRKFVPLRLDFPLFESELKTNKFDIDWSIALTIGNVGTLLLFLAIWVMKFFKD